MHVAIEHRLKDPNLDLRRAVRGANYGSEDYEFDLSSYNRTDTEQRYTVEYIASNRHRLTAIATTEVVVPARTGDKSDSRCP